MFFRIKKIKGREYAYLVENRWHKKGSRQKVKGYIGRVYRFDLKNDTDFLKFMKIEDFEGYIKNNENKKMINDLIEWELFKFGINRQEFSIDLNNLKVQRQKKSIALLVNDGCLCNVTLKNLLQFKPEGDEEADGYRLAKAFVEAGIKVPKEIFIGLFGKLYKQTI